MALLTAAGARAQDAAAGETRWYGWQVMLADAAGGALVAAGAQKDNAAMIAAGAISLAVTPALIHLAHHAPGDAGLSLAVRILPIGVSLGLFALIHPECGEGCSELAIPAMGALLSGVGVIADWAFLSTERIEPTLSLAPIAPLDRRRGSGLALTLRF